jgi:hypothetical protein
LRIEATFEVCRHAVVRGDDKVIGVAVVQRELMRMSKAAPHGTGVSEARLCARLLTYRAF